MMRILYILLFLAITLSGFSQTRTITGQLTDDTGEPIPGVNIVIKGTRIGTQTDLDGNYTIDAPVGSTLVFSYVGLETREVVVTENWPRSTKTHKSRTKKKELLPDFPVALLYDTITDQEGVGFFDFDSKIFKSYSNLDISKIHKISEKKNQFVIKSWDDQTIRKGYGFQYSQVFGILKVTQLPRLQSIYAQGRPNGGFFEWFGPESNESFSWGPRVRNLEFDGSSYPYDQNGRLVPIGAGNGVPAKSYDNLDFFKVGFTNSHSFMFNHSISRRGNLVTKVNWDNQTSIIPNASKEKFSTGIDLEDLSVGRNGEISFRSSYSSSNGMILSHGANLSRIMADVLGAPLTFDNSNNLSNKQATNNASSYEIDSQQKRAYSPVNADNPYGIVSTSRDRDQLSNYFSAIEYEWSNQYQNENYWNIKANGSYNRQELNSRFGVPLGYIGSPSGLFVVRDDEKSQIDFRITPRYRLSYSGYPNWNLTFTMDYHYSAVERSIERGDGSNFLPNSAFTFEEAITQNRLLRSLDRASHQLSHSVRFKYENYTLNLGNTYYTSNTVNQSDFLNFFPFIGFRTDIYIDGFEFYPRVSYSRSIQESALIYNDWAYISTSTQSGQFKSVNETSELFFHADLKPEITSKLEFDLDASIYYNVDLTFTYDYETIEDFIAPINASGQFNLDNVAKVANESFRVGVRYYSYSWGNRPTWTISTRWTKKSPRVIETSSSSPIPVSGFNNVFSALAAGQPFGTIYGTFYERDSENNRIIDNSGYPIVSNELKAIANPNPDWMINLDGTIRWKNLRLEALFEYVHGGSIWNGTSAYLDYIGRSYESGKLRETTNFIYVGVDQNGDVNSIPVDFLDPGQDISQSRWVRYGAEGVAEEYIEDASSFRLSELILGYSIPVPKSSKLRELSFSLTGRNLFQLTPYSGVDPQSALFGYSLGHGLDMFNVPSTRSYQLKMIVKL